MLRKQMKWGARLLAYAMAISLPAAAEVWREAYSYDGEGSSLKIVDLAFGSGAQGVAVGTIESKGVIKPVSLTTSDGGEHWAIVPLKQVPTSVFFLEGGAGWMTAEGGIWKTGDGGRNWSEMWKSPEKTLQVYFLDTQRGFAVGAEKGAYRTADGGRTWKPIAEAAAPDTRPDNTTYNAISFATPKAGLISGYSSPPRKDDSGRELPHLSIMLDTRDAGETWSPSTASMFGRIEKAVFLRDGRGLGLIEFKDKFQWPSEVHRLDGGSGKSDIAFAEKNRAITDLVMTEGGLAYIAGTEAPEGESTGAARRVKILKSADLEKWQEMEIDGPVKAGRVILRRAPDGTLWAATDTGTILKLGD